MAKFQQQFLPIAITALVTAIVVGALTLSPRAHAQGASTAVCEYKFEGSPNVAKVYPAMTEWMNAQIAAGKTHFIPVGGTNIAPGICAW